MARFRSRGNWILTALLLAALFRFHALGEDTRFHPDEALFATFARSAAVHGDWMLPGALDKTPLSMYISALGLHFGAAYMTDTGIIAVDLRTGEFAARLPHTLAGMMLVALIYPLAAALYPRERRLPVVAILLAALSPYLIVFSAAAFTDMLMLALMSAALLAAARGRPGWSGWLLALSIAAKQQGVFYLPLILGTLWLRGGLSGRSALRFGLALAAGIGLLLAWDAVRPGTSVFALAAAHNDPERLLVTPGEWLPRLGTWLDHTGWLLGPPLITAGLVVTGLAAWLTGDGSSHRRTDRLLWGYILGYVALHWLAAFNTYDRYLLPLVPLLAIVCGRGVLWLWGLSVGHRRRRFLWLAVLILCVPVMIAGAYQAAREQTEIAREGREFIDSGDIIALADHLNAKPLGTIIYDHWLGWELGYYLGAWTDKRRVYYPAPAALATDARRNPDLAPRYLVAPVGVPVEPWLQALAEVGFAITPEDNPTGFIIYRLIPPRPPVDAADAGAYAPDRASAGGAGG
jgi:4-amino-4-deoxy-L-arabinose transferase-like glycosyltransferase